ncbi:MAG: hypothetical protein ACRDQF_05110, partial [Thermocrispum sp.]
MSYPGGQQFDPYSGQSVPHQYGGGSTYRGLGAFDEPPRRSRKPIVLGVVAALITVGLGFGAYYLVSDDTDRSKQSQQQTPAPPASGSSAPPSSGSPESSGTSTRGGTKTAPVVEGWQVVASSKDGAAFDVSQDWEVETPDTLTGFENGDGVRSIMHSVATYRSGFC